MDSVQPVESSTKDHDKRALRILAKSVFKELRQNGYSRSEIVRCSTELLGLLTTDIRSDESSESPA